MVNIPISSLSEAALAGVIDAFILREGTDYGHQDLNIDEKRKRVRRQLENGRAGIFYYPATDHVAIDLVGD